MKIRKRRHLGGKGILRNKELHRLGRKGSLEIGEHHLLRGKKGLKIEKHLHLDGKGAPKTGEAKERSIYTDIISVQDTPLLTIRVVGVERTRLSKDR